MCVFMCLSCVYLCVFVFIYAYAHVFVCVCIYIAFPTVMYICVYALIMHTFMCLYMSVCTTKCSQNATWHLEIVDKQVYTYTHVYIYAYVHIYIHMHTRVYTHIHHIHVYIHGCITWDSCTQHTTCSAECA